MALGSTIVSLVLLVLAVSTPLSAQPNGGAPEFLSEATEDGITERRFDLVVNGETVPGVLWTPEGAKGARPLVLFGHGGGQNKRADNILRMVRELVGGQHYAAVAIDGPAHGERVTPDEAAALRDDSTARRAAVRRIDTTAEWSAVLDAVQQLDEVGEGPVGYWGLSMGTRVGVPLVAAEERIDAAILGLFGLFPEGRVVKEGFEADARSIDVPLIFVFQWDDSLMSREVGLELYDAFASEDKAMHINPGGHIAVPRSETESWTPFWIRHLGEAKVVQGG